MARLSLWKDGRHSADYKFIDRRISEMFTIGGTGVLLNKYLGPKSQGTQISTSATQTAVNGPLIFPNTTGVKIGDFVTGPGIPVNTTVTSITTTTVTLSANVTAPLGTGVTVGFSDDATKPSYTNQSEKNIQDLLWLENRDRKYDTNVYKMRGHYQRADQDFDLSQFGLFLQTGTIFMTFHLRDMVDQIGRKLMSGDVLEFEHLKDYDGLDTDLPAALKRFYVVGDASFASEGFSPTWWPHLWRVKLSPLVDSQEFKDILKNIQASTGNATPVGQIISTYDKYLNINQTIIAQAEHDVPLSGYDTKEFYTLPTTEDGKLPLADPLTADTTVIQADNTNQTADNGPGSPLSKIKGYLTGDGTAPNGLPIEAGVAFPNHPHVGDYFLRLDYLPNRLFRYNGVLWIKIEDNVRTNISNGATNNLTQRASYMNNNNTYTDSQGAVHKELQPLSRALTPKADNGN
ncbi:MAG TPA: hypothetical protein VFM18_19230 [Methanosarcina sp.]|nr:hypothetical protein [Methanosarcina sp.]